MKFKPVQFFYIFIIVLILHIFLFERIIPLLQTQSVSQTHSYQKIQISFLQEQKKPQEHKIKQEKKLIVEKLPIQKQEVKINKQKQSPIKVTKQVKLEEKAYPLKKEQEKTQTKKIEVEKKVVTKEQISKITEEKESQTREVREDVSLAKKEAILNTYMQYVYQTINAHKFYPKLAKRMGVEGKCKLGFKILCDGSIEGVKILEKSSFTALNTAALEIMKQIGKFHAFPAVLEKKEITLEVPIEYSLKGEK